VKLVFFLTGAQQASSPTQGGGSGAAVLAVYQVKVGVLHTVLESRHVVMVLGCAV
jgi:hypothetical protein